MLIVTKMVMALALAGGAFGLWVVSGAPVTQPAAVQESPTGEAPVLLASTGDAAQTEQAKLPVAPEEVAPMFGFGEMVDLNDADQILEYIAYPLMWYLRTSDPPGMAFISQGGWAGLSPVSGPLHRLPAVEALVKIGEPAVQPVLAKFTQTDHVTEQCCCLRVLVELKGKAQTERMLQEALTKTPEGPDRAHLRLKNSLDLLRKLF
jgi:hypothetical protein